MAQTRGGERIPVCVLAVLPLLLPFEPRRPTLHLLGLELTALELAAGAAILLLLSWGRARLPSLLQRPPPPLALLGAFAAAHLLSAALAPFHREEAAKFALRMVAAWLFAVGVSLAPREAHRRGLAALAVGAAVVALLALLEALGLRPIDPFLGLFREMPFVVGGTRRASAGSEYPNLAAALMMYGLLAGVGLAASGRRPQRIALPLSALVSLGLLTTYSRSAVLAAMVGLATLAAALGSRDRARAAGPTAAALVLLLASVAFGIAGATFRVRLTADEIGSWYHAHYEPAEASLSLTPGESRTVSVRVTNTGRERWSGTGRYFLLGYHWWGPESGAALVDGHGPRLDRDLAPQESVDLGVRIVAPRQEGRYVLLWDIGHQYMGWFSRLGVSPGAVPVSVSRSAAPLLPTPGAIAPRLPTDWRPRRSELWGLALAMWRAHPLTGVGSDNFRWSYGPYAGRSTWDHRTFANNAFLEIAATTGTLGLLTFVGTLLATARSALRVLAGAAAGSGELAWASVLLALTAGLTCHGAADYVLAFTGHYLFFGFVVGAASSREGSSADAIGSEVHA